MKWVKAPEELKGVLAAGMEGIDCEKRLMFGYPAYFINSNMFSGLFQASVFIRLSPEPACQPEKAASFHRSARTDAWKTYEGLFCHPGSSLQGPAVFQEGGRGSG